MPSDNDSPRRHGNPLRSFERRFNAACVARKEAEPPLDEVRPAVMRFPADLAEIATRLEAGHPALVGASSAVADASAKLRRYDDGFYASDDKLAVARAAWAAIEAASSALAAARTAAGLSLGNLGLAEERERNRARALKDEGGNEK